MTDLTAQFDHFCRKELLYRQAGLAGSATEVLFFYRRSTI